MKPVSIQTDNHQTNYQALNSLERAHTVIHRAIDNIKKGNTEISKQQQAEIIRYVATALANS